MDKKTKQYLEYGVAGIIAAGAIYFALKSPLPPLIQPPQPSSPSTSTSSMAPPPQQQTTPQTSQPSAQCPQLSMGFGSISTLRNCFPGTVNSCGFPSDVVGQGFCEYAWDNANYSISKPSNPGLVVYNPYNKWFAVFAVNSAFGYHDIPTCTPNCNFNYSNTVAFDIFYVYPNGYTFYPSWAIPYMTQYGNIFFYTQSGAYVDYIATSSELQYIYQNNIQVVKTVIDPSTKGFEIGVVAIPGDGCLAIAQPNLSNTQTVFQLQSGIDFPLWFDNSTQIQFCYGCNPNNCKTLTPMPL